ncbi:transcriptional regulator [Polymorphobacter glacialis]|uniref:Transcriptional regulator n=2 Tax=Sandarakinorhabdus glacialis TaxID=1614636 RepID=A0A917E349_9SPHN|nr:transcriptional regulator [Polymorphobacter glacialis]
MTSQQRTEPSTDGRRRRSEVSRDRIVAAMLALVEEGAISPSAEDVAVRARVGLRSVFRHFSDMDNLYAEMTLRLAQGYETALAPFESSDWRGRLVEATERRTAIFERLLPFKRAADAHRHESPAIQSHHEGITLMLRTRLLALMPPHLENNTIVFESLDLLLSIDTWARLRFEQALTPEIARDVITAQIGLLIKEQAPLCPAQPN